jgi:predicted NBD/HSP70 family sugar kinase
MTYDVFVGVDIGGSHLGVGFLSDDCVTLCDESLQLNMRLITPEEAIDTVVQMIETMRTRIANQKQFRESEILIKAVGIGCPGSSFYYRFVT